MRVENTNDSLYEPPPLPEAGNEAEDEFLKLLVAQMQNQDPLNPQDGAEFVAQLAQFTNIEIGIETNERLAGLQAAEQSASRASMMGLVGQTIKADPSNFRLTQDGPPLDFTVDLDDAASSVEIVIYDENGTQVRTIDGGSHSAGTTTIAWDGMDSEGLPVPAGDYSMEVIATDGEQGVINATASLTGLTTSVEFTPEGATLFGMGPVLMDPSAILSITETD